MWVHISSSAAAEKGAAGMQEPLLESCQVRHDMTPMPGHGWPSVCMLMGGCRDLSRAFLLILTCLCPCATSLLAPIRL